MTCQNPWRFASICIALLALAAPAMAQVTPVIFERSDIRINPGPAPATKEGEAPPPARTSISYNVEVRSEEALQLEYIHTLNTLDRTNGVVIFFNAPSVVALPAMQVFTPVDALFVADDGTVLQIYPDVVLGELQQEVYAKDAIRAFVFLKAGEVAAHHLQPRDIITGAMFTPAPPVME